MSIYEDWFVKIGVVFNALYFENEVGVTPKFFVGRQVLQNKTFLKSNSLSESNKVGNEK